MADIFGSVAAPRLNWSQDNSSASRALLGGMEIGLQKRRLDLAEKDENDKLAALAQRMAAQERAASSMQESMRSSGVKDEETMSQWLANNPQWAVHPLTAPLVKDVAGVFSNLARIKLAATTEHVRSIDGQTELAAMKFAADQKSAAMKTLLDISKSLGDDSGAQSEVSALMESGINPQTKASVLLNGITQLRSKYRLSTENASIKRLYTEDGTPVDVLERPGGLPQRIPTHRDEEEARKSKELEILKAAERKADAAYQTARAKAVGAAGASTVTGFDKSKLPQAQGEAEVLLERRNELRDQIARFGQKETAGASASPKKPTRSMASDYVKKYGRDKAIEQLKSEGYDTSGYAD